jgi:hypothetical protein
MANTLRFKRGLASGIPTGVAGEPLFTTDTFDLYIGNGTTNTRFQKYIASGTTSQYLRGDGTLATFPSLTGFVPYTGATANVDLGVYTILAQNATISSNGSGNTATITHSSGSGIALNITKGGNGEGLYINKTSGTGNAATIIGTLNATTLVKSGGTSTQYLMADGTTSTLTNPITGTGTAGQVAYFTSATTQAGNNNLFWNNTNGRLGIGTNAPISNLDIYNLTSAITTIANGVVPDGTKTGGTLSLVLGGNGAAIGNYVFANDILGKVSFYGYGNNFFYEGAVIQSVVTTGGNVGRASHIAALDFYTKNSGPNVPTLNMRLTGTGNLLLGSTTDSGEKLQVTGTAKITGDLTANNYRLSANSGKYYYLDTGTGNNFLGLEATNTFGLYIAGSKALGIASTGAATFSSSVTAASGIITGNLTVDTNTLFVDATNNRVGIGTASPLAENLLQVSRDANGQNIVSVENPNTGTGAYAEFQARNTNASNSTSLRIMAMGTGYTTAGGFLQNSGVVNADVSLTGGLSIMTRANAPIRFYTNGHTNERMRVTELGNLHIGTFSSDSGEKLQVTGTAKITGASSFGGNMTLSLNHNSNTSFLVQNTNSGSSAQTSILVQSDGGTASFNAFSALNGDFPNTAILSSGLLSNGLYLNTSTTSPIIFRTNLTERMRMTSLGNLLINTTTDSGEKIRVNGTILISNSTIFSYSGLDATGALCGTSSNHPFRLVTNNTERLQIASTGEATFTSSVTAASATITGNLTVDSNTLFVDATANEVGIGTNAPNSSLQVVGSVSKSISDVKTANYTATATDHTILCSAAGGGFTITLPASSGITGRIYVIKKTNASSGLNNITIDGNGAETIDGAATLTLQCRSSVTLQCDGSNWHILSLYSDTLCL